MDLSLINFLLISTVCVVPLSTRHGSYNRTPQKGRLLTLSSDDRRGDLNDDKVILFDNSSHRTRRTGSISEVESSIRRYIRSIDAKLESRMNSKKASQHRTSLNNRTMLAARGRAQKMGFIGDLTKVKIEKAAKKSSSIEQCSSSSSSHSVELDDATATFPTRNGLPEDVKLLPKIPSVECHANREEEEQIERVDEEEDLIADKSTRARALSKAQPSENKPENARIDLSLPTVDSILNDLRTEYGNSSSSAPTAECNESKMSEKSDDSADKFDITGGTSAMRSSYRNIISSKLEKYKSSPSYRESEEAASVREEQIENERSEPDQKQSIHAPSSTKISSPRHQSDLAASFSRNSEIGSETMLRHELCSEIPILTSSSHQQHRQMDKFKVLN